MTALAVAAAESGGNPATALFAIAALCFAIVALPPKKDPTKDPKKK